ncbi:HNH endonuclease [Streptomyces collinus]|uniref:HNH endonuclease n=1 Tax=Streptomyces collinus TaxID=42684 RepID=UPI0037BA8B83
MLTSADGWCTYCGSMGVRAEVVDHIVPLEQGGADDITNLVPACRSCNASKRDRTPEQWRKSLEHRYYGPPGRGTSRRTPTSWTTPTPG